MKVIIAKAASRVKYKIITRRIKEKMKNETCDVLVVAGLGVMEEPLWVEEAELIELLLPRAPKVLCEPFSCCDGA